MKVDHRSVLVVEDEKNMREVLSMLLEGEGHSVTTAKDGIEGIAHIEKEIFDIVITDIKMPGADGFEILRKVKEISPDTLVIIITAYGTYESAIDAMKQGAYDYVQKPFKIDEIRLIVRNAIDRRMLTSEVSVLRDTVKRTSGLQNIIGKSPRIEALISMIHRAARNSSNVLITGESGTGKELVALALHNLGPNSERNFVAINCSSLPEGLLETELFGHMKGAFTGAVQNKQGLFEIAHEGTLFLDEIGDMPLSLQSKLLRAIENGTFRRVGGTTDIKVNTRIIAATNKNLKEASISGAFRDDLYFRLNVIPLYLPPLRERKDDIPLLVEHFVRKYSKSNRQFSGGALKLLTDYGWKGNIRELENTIERTLLFTDRQVITDDDLPDEIRKHKTAYHAMPSIGPGFALDDYLSTLEVNYIKEALSISGGRKKEAASLLGLSFRSFRHKMSKYNL